MDEKDRVSFTSSPPQSTCHYGDARRPSYLPSSLEDSQDIDVFRAVHSAFTPSSVYESTEQLPQPRRSKRWWITICAALIMILVLVGLVIGLVVWRAQDAAAPDKSSSDHASTTLATATPTWTTDGHGPELFPARTSTKAGSDSTITITPAAFTMTMTLVRPNATPIS